MDRASIRTTREERWPYAGPTVNPVFRFISFLLGLGWIAFMLATPLLGVWLASSLISLHGGPRELALIGGRVVGILSPRQRALLALLLVHPNRTVSSE